MLIPADKKRVAVEEVLKKQRGVTEVAKELGVARKTIYEWVKRYKETPARIKGQALTPRYVSGKKHPRVIAPDARGALVRLIKKHPEWGCRKLSAELNERGIGLGYFGVYKLLKELGASTPDLRVNYARNWSGPGRLEANIKLSVVRAVLEDKKKVSWVAKEFGVARKTIYEWLRKYEQAMDEGIVGAAALKEAYVRAEIHPRAVYPGIQEQLLNIVAKNPGLSIRQLARQLPVSSWTVWKVLDRNQLNLYEQRLAFAQARQEAARLPGFSWLVDRLNLVWEQFLPSLAPAPPPSPRLRRASPPVLRLIASWISHLASVASFLASSARLGFVGLIGLIGQTGKLPAQLASLTPASVSSSFSNFFRYQFKPLGYSSLITFIIILGSLWYADLLAAAPSWSARIGYLFASLSLASGTLFFLYSAKYYLLLAAVLSFSQGEQEQRSEDGDQRAESGLTDASSHPSLTTNSQPLISKFVSWLFGATPSKRLGDAAIGLQASLDQVTIKDDQYPKITVCLPVYNEKRVVERLLKACTGFDYQGAYQVLVLDDSTDETTGLIKSLLGITRHSEEGTPPSSSHLAGGLSEESPTGVGSNPHGIASPAVGGVAMTDKEEAPNDGESSSNDTQVYHSTLNGVPVTLVHRQDRTGFKGGALAEALNHTDADSQFTVVFDADFIPFPDTLKLFVKYFKAAGAWSESSNPTFDREHLTIDRKSQQDFSNNLSNVTGQMPARQSFSEGGSNVELPHPEVVAVQGYQWHVLNKNENWITRGVRTEYSGSYVIERSGLEIFSGLKQIAGSVYAVKTAVLRELGWGNSITEDFQLTLKLYQRGYKVLYTPYIQGPAECVSTLKRLIRQRMRWAEGHSHNIRKMLVPLLFPSMFSDHQKTASSEAAIDGSELIRGSGLSSNNTLANSSEFVKGNGPEGDRTPGTWLERPVPNQSGPIPPSNLSGLSGNHYPKLTFSEKLELLFLSPYYLQAAFFLLGTTCWLISEAILKAPLPFWTSVWGWSLVLTNFFSLPLSNSVGLFMEEAEERDYLGITSFILLSYLLVPFQAYASLKGFLEPEEGTWFRTPKSGLITISLARGRFYRFLRGILPQFGMARVSTGAQLLPAFLNHRTSALPNWSSSPSLPESGVNPKQPYALTPSNSWKLNLFGKNFKLAKRFLFSKAILASLLAIVMFLNYAAFWTVPVAQSAPGRHFDPGPTKLSESPRQNLKLTENSLAVDIAQGKFGYTTQEIEKRIQQLDQQIANQEQQLKNLKNTLTEQEIQQLGLDQTNSSSNHRVTEVYRYTVNLADGSTYSFGLQEPGGIKPVVKMENQKGEYVRFEPVQQVQADFVTPKVNGDIIEWELKPGLTARYTVKRDRVKADYILESPFVIQSAAKNPQRDEPIPVLQFQLTFSNSKENPTVFLPHPDGSISLMDTNHSQELFKLLKPTVHDANGAEGPATLDIQKTSLSTATLTLSLDQGFLETATYPITIDPTVLYSSTSSMATAYGNGRNIVRDTNGNLIASYVTGASALRIDYSNDRGVSWSNALHGGSNYNDVSIGLDSSNNKLYIAHGDAPTPEVAVSRYSVSYSGSDISSISLDGGGGP